MVAYASRELQVLRDTPANIPGQPAYGGRMRRYRATIRLNDLRINSGSGTAAAGIAINDDFLIADIPPGQQFVGVEIVSGIALATTTINIGQTQVHATNISIATGLTVPTANLKVDVNAAASRALAAMPAGRYYATFATTAVAASANDIVIDVITVAA